MFSFSRILKYFWLQMRKNKWRFFGVVTLLSARALVGNIIAPLYFKNIIDTISNLHTDRALLFHTLFPTFLIIIGCYAFVVVSARIREFLNYTFATETVRNLRNFAFQKIEKNSSSFFVNTFSGSLVTKTRRFVNSFESMLDVFLWGFLNVSILLVGSFVVLIQESKIISLIFFLSIALYVTVVAFLVKKKFKYDLLEAEQDSKISGRLADIFGNILAVKFFSARTREISSFGEYTTEGAKRSKQALYYAGKIEITQSIFQLLIQAAMLYALIHLWQDNVISTGTVVLVETYTTLILNRIWDLGNSLTRFMKAVSDAKEIIDIFEITPDILDPEKPEKLRIKEGHILFDNIHFRYALGGDVLSNFTLEVKPGERVGLVGHSGAGKSTITKLILRLSDISSGTVTIDGQNIKNITQDDLRGTISYVPQEPILFHRSIKENINYGKPNATQEEIKEVATKAHAHEFISQLPKGYDTLVGERGVKLSGGERQRVAIARAMLKQSPILVLDEATSSLDSISESYIQEAFDELMKGKTTIVIAHRLSTIQKMDRIVVLDKGKIVEEGTHKELLNRDGVYKSLWDHQTGGFLEE